MIRFARHRMIAVGAAAAAAALLTVASSASAMDEILLTVPVSGVHRGAEGTSVRVASVDVPAALVGQSCEIFGSTVNQQSVHPGNDLLIMNGDESFTIPNFEDEGDIVHDAGDVETLGATIQLFVVFGPDGASSGGFRVTVRNCGEEVTETTTPVSTTEPVETTTVSSVDSTTPDTTQPDTTTSEPATTETTSESVDPAGPTAETSTTMPLDSSTSTTAAASTTTEVATTEAPDTSAAPDPLGPTATDTLPVTGSPTWWIVGSGLVLAMAGAALTLSSRFSLE